MPAGLATSAARAVAALVARPVHVAVAAACAGLALAALAPAAVVLVPVLVVLVAAGLSGAANAGGNRRRGAGEVARDRRWEAGEVAGHADPGGVGGPARAGGRERLTEVLVLAALALAGGAELGHAQLAAIDRFADRVVDGAPLGARVSMLGHPRPGPLGASVEVRVLDGRLRGARLLGRLPPWAGTLDGVAIGAELRVRGRVRSLERIAADDRRREFEVAAWLRRRGLAGELLLTRAAATGRRRGGLVGALDRVRDRAERAVVAGLPPDRAALLRGMVLGQDEAIEQPARDEFEASGLAHVLAVSGQNVMLLAALALPALIAAGLGARARGLALLVLIALYVPLAGAGPSLQRAGVMGAAGIAAMLAARPASRSYALLLAAALTLALNPRAIGDPGWQLSFAAVAGILVLGRPLARALRDGLGALAGPSRSAPRAIASVLAEASVARPGRAARAAASVPAEASAARPGRVARAAANVLADGIALTVSSTLATAPLLAHHFGSVSLASLPANVLALPAVAPAMWLGMLKIAVGQLALAGLPTAALAGALGQLAAVPVGAIATLAERFAVLPLGQLRIGLGSPLAVAVGYLGIAVVVVAVRRAAPPLLAHAGAAGSGWRRRSPATRLAILVVIAGGAALLAADELAPPRPPDTLVVRFLDVGQGDATLIQHPDGTALLFDGGPPDGGVVRLLRRAGVRRLALVVATHASRDHHGGLLSVLDAVPVDLFLDGGDGSRDPGFRALVADAGRRGIRRLPALAPLDLRAGAIRVRILSPPPRPAGPPPEDPNPRAVTAIVGCGDFDLLLSADAESPTLLALPLPDVDAIKLPHHGSADAGLPDVLDRLRPEAAGITVGANTYGHPAPSTLTALARAGVRAWRTDRDGTITIAVAAGEMHVETAR